MKVLSDDRRKEKFMGCKNYKKTEKFEGGTEKNNKKNKIK